MSNSCANTQSDIVFFQEKQSELKKIAIEHLDLNYKQVNVEMQISELSTRKSYDGSEEAKNYYLKAKIHVDDELVLTVTENMLHAPEITSKNYKFFEASKIIFSKSDSSSYGQGDKVESSYQYNKQGDLEELNENVYASRGTGSHRFTRHSKYHYDYDDKDRVIDYIKSYEERPLSRQPNSVSYRYCKYEYLESSTSN